MLLSEDHLAVQDAVRAYVQDCIAPHAARWPEPAGAADQKAAPPLAGHPWERTLMRDGA